MKLTVESKKHKKKKKPTRKQKAWGWFVHPNAGNVEYNIDQFNNAMDVGSISTSGDVGTGMGESKETERGKSMNIREELLKLDGRAYRGLTEMYDSVRLSKEENKYIQEALEKKTLVDLQNFLESKAGIDDIDILEGDIELVGVLESENLYALHYTDEETGTETLAVAGDEETLLEHQDEIESLISGEFSEYWEIMLGSLRDEGIEVYSSESGEVFQDEEGHWIVDPHYGENIYMVDKLVNETEDGEYIVEGDK